MDPLTDFDWFEHWRGLVEGRRDQTGGPRQNDFWTRRAASFATSSAQRDDPLLGVLEPYLSPHATLLDVGAGTGRHSVPLADRLAWVTAVEPSLAMRSHIPELANLTVIASEFLDADAAAADLVLCSNVLYPIAEPRPFIEKLESLARQRVFVVMRDAPNPHPAEVITRGVRVREPRLADLYMLLHQMGVEPDVAAWRQSAEHHWESLEAAIEDCRGRAGLTWPEGPGEAFLKAQLAADPERAGVVYRGPDYSVGVAHWSPRR